MDVHALIDERAISRIYMRYCDIVDSKDFDRLDEVFTPDTQHDYTQSMPGVVTDNLAMIVGAMTLNLGAGSLCGATHHNVTNFRIEVTGDSATAKVHYIAAHAGTGRMAGHVYTMWGEYDDRLVRTLAGWRVRDRIYTTALTQGEIVTLADRA